jgi:hypothetical protein
MLTLRSLSVGGATAAVGTVELLTTTVDTTLALLALEALVLLVTALVQSIVSLTLSIALALGLPEAALLDAWCKRLLLLTVALLATKVTLLLVILLLLLLGLEASGTRVRAVTALLLLPLTLVL